MLSFVDHWAGVRSAILADAAWTAPPILGGRQEAGPPQSWAGHAARLRRAAPAGAHEKRGA